MAVNRRDIRITRGTDRTFRITVFDPDTDDDDPIDISGSTIVFTVTKLPGDGTPLITKSTPAEILILAQVGDTLGQADISLVPADTAPLVGLHFYDVYVTLPSGKVHNVILPARFFIEATPNT